MAIKQISSDLSFSVPASGAVAVGTLPFVPLKNWPITVFVNGVSDDPQFSIQLIEQSIIANPLILGEKVKADYWVEFDEAGQATGESSVEYDYIISKPEIQAMINGSLSPVVQEIDETITKTLFVTLRTDTDRQVVDSVSEGSGESESETQPQINYEIVYVPPFWPELYNSTASGHNLDNLAAIQAALKIDGEQLQGVISASI